MTQKTGRLGASGREFCLCSLEKEDIEEALQLMDRCVGENLYQKEELEQAIGSSERAFLLLRTAEGELAGYIYYYLTNEKQIAEDTRLTENPTGMPAGYFGTCWQDPVSRNKRSISQTGSGSWAYELCIESVCGEGHRGSVYHLLECRR